MMLKKVIELFRVLIFSFEFLTILIFIILYMFFTQFLEKVGGKVLESNDINNYLLAIPIALLVTSIKLASDLLMPFKEADNSILYNWPDFWKFKLRVWVAISVSISAGIVSLVALFFSEFMDNSTVSCLFFGGIIVSGIAVFSEIIAKFKLREILDSFNNDQ